MKNLLDSNNIWKGSLVVGGGWLAWVLVPVLLPIVLTCLLWTVAGAIAIGVLATVGRYWDFWFNFKRKEVKNEDEGAGHGPSTSTGATGDDGPSYEQPTTDT